MGISDIKVESDIMFYLGGRYEQFKETINKIFGTHNIDFYGTEYDIPKYYGGRRQYGGGRCDMLYGNSEMLVPVELKYEAYSNGYLQLKRYIKLLEERSKKEINGILVCYKATKSLKELKIDDNVAIIELSTGKVW